VCVRGLTLVELLAALAVAAVLLGMALPAMRHLVDQQRAAAAINQVAGAVNFARASAIEGRRTVSLCPSPAREPDAYCAGRDEWPIGMLVFSDGNGNGRRDAGEATLRRLPALPPGATLRWRSFRNRSYLQFLPSGLTPWQNGHFLLCLRDDDPRLARMLVVNAAGRLRHARDRDGDGVREDAQGRPLDCAG